LPKSAGYRIGEPASTKQQQNARGPEIHQTHKGKQWYFGAELMSGWTARAAWYTARCSRAANVHDKHTLPQLLHGQRRSAYGYSAYTTQKALNHSNAPKAPDLTNQNTRHAGGGSRTGSALQKPKEVEDPGQDRTCLRGRQAGLRGFTLVRNWGRQRIRTAFAALALVNVCLSQRRSWFSDSATFDLLTRGKFSGLFSSVTPSPKNRIKRVRDEES